MRINSDFRTICIGIGKVVNKNLDVIYVQMSNNNLPISFNRDSIAKYSKNIIDLIKVGDYVNGYRVYHAAGHYVAVESLEKYDCFEEQDIKTIVTREQFASMKYKVGE